MTAQRPCPRCLIENAPDGEALAALIQQWIDAIPDDRRTEGALYEARLSACQRCPHLAAGTCALCGCYVAYRAAQARMKCPDVPGRWGLREQGGRSARKTVQWTVFSEAGPAGPEAGNRNSGCRAES